MQSASRQRIRIGDLLVSNKLISESQLNSALKEQKNSGRKLGRTLIDMGFVSEDDLLSLLSRQLGIPFVNLANYQLDRELVQLIPETVARRFRVLALREESDGVMIAMSDPSDIFAYDEVSRLLRRPIKQAVVREGELLDTIDIAYHRSAEIANLAEELKEEIEETAFDLQTLGRASDDSDAPVVRLLQKIFENALRSKASDIHIEPDETVVRIRNRVDGVLREQVMKEKAITSSLVVRLKLMAGLDISEKRIPQDGRFQVRVGERGVDVRLATVPVQFGESVVMRLLDQSEGIKPLSETGMPENIVERFRRAISRPHGLVLVTGPTGSGKTTSLYGAIHELNTPERKIITVEDPVEYRLPRISQIQINEKIDLDFAKILRAALRADPDVLLVGEMRDKESAEIGLRAAITGHLVLSTLHTNDAISSAMRLIDLGIDGYLVATALHAVVAQRLVKKICSQCSAPYELSIHDKEWLIGYLNAHHTSSSETDEILMTVSKMRFLHGRGCSSCNETGYAGRIGVFELLEINQPMADAMRRNDVAGFTQAAKADPTYRTLMDNAYDLAEAGVTTLEEVIRVAAMSDQN